MVYGNPERVKPYFAVSPRFRSDAAAERKDQPLDRTLAVLEQSWRCPAACAVATLATELGLPLPSAARLVAQLEARGLIRARSARVGCSGSAAHQPGPGCRARGIHGDAAHLLLVGLASRLGEHCQIGVVAEPRWCTWTAPAGARGASLQVRAGRAPADPTAPLPASCSWRSWTTPDWLAFSAGVRCGAIRRPPSPIPATLIVPVREARRRGWAVRPMANMPPAWSGCAADQGAQQRHAGQPRHCHSIAAHAVQCGAPVRSGIARRGEGDRCDDRSGSRGDVTGGRDRRSRRLPSVSPAIVTSASGETCSGAAAPGRRPLPIWWPGQDMPGSRRGCFVSS